MKKHKLGDVVKVRVCEYAHTGNHFATKQWHTVETKIISVIQDEKGIKYEVLIGGFKRSVRSDVINVSVEKTRKDNKDLYVKRIKEFESYIKRKEKEIKEYKQNIKLLEKMI